MADTDIWMSLQPFAPKLECVRQPAWVGELMKDYFAAPSDHRPEP